MSKESQKPLEAKVWTYVDVLALAVAQAEAKEFTRDRLAWHALIEKLQVDIKDNPQLLGDITFDTRRRSEHFSDEVDIFLNIMIGSEALVLMPRSYAISQRARDQIIALQGGTLAKYADTIAMLSKAFDEELGIPQTTS